MFKFLLVIVEVDEDNEAGDRTLFKKVSWPIVPKVGEFVSLADNCHPVIDVIHRIGDEPVGIEVLVEWPKGDFKHLCTDPSWEKKNF